MTNHGYGYGVSLSQHSQPSKDESFERNSQNLATLSQGTRHLVGDNAATPFAAHSIQPSPCPDQRDVVHGGGHSSGGGKSNNRGRGNISANMNKKLKQPMKPKGRPPGSKNKPKIDNEALKHVVIEISAGCDVVEELIKFAEIYDVGLTVLSGSGSVTNVTLSHTFSQTPSSLMTLHGTFTMLSLSGTYVKTNNFTSPFASSSSSSLPNTPPSSSSFSAVPSPGYSYFTICLAGVQGEIFGGVIAGRIIASSLVVVVAALYKKPMFHRVQNNGTNTSFIDLSDVDPLKGDTNASLMALLASFDNAANSSSPALSTPAVSTPAGEPM